MKIQAIIETAIYVNDLDAAEDFYGTGQVPTGGYDKKKINLVRVTYLTPPEDGIQDYVLFAVPPSGFATQVISEVKAGNRWKGYAKEAPWIKGIRVHGVDEGVVVKMLPKAK